MDVAWSVARCGAAFGFSAVLDQSWTESVPMCLEVEARLASPAWASVGMAQHAFQRRCAWLD
eukprot:522775-Pyramimonas_sp.AAC.1